MQSIICFGTFLFLLNLPPYLWFIVYSGNINGYKETFPFFAITTTATFILYLICLTLYCYGIYGNFKLLKLNNKISFLWSLVVLFMALFLIDLIACISCANANYGSSVIILAFIPVTILVFVSFYIYHALYFSILEVVQEILSLSKKNGRKDSN